VRFISRAGGILYLAKKFCERQRDTTPYKYFLFGQTDTSVYLLSFPVAFLATYATDQENNELALSCLLTNFNKVTLVLALLGTLASCCLMAISIGEIFKKLLNSRRLPNHMNRFKKFSFVCAGALSLISTTAFLEIALLPNEGDLNIVSYLCVLVGYFSVLFLGLQKLIAHIFIVLCDSLVMIRSFFINNNSSR
jgi:hypothetical protein